MDVKLTPDNEAVLRKYCSLLSGSRTNWPETIISQELGHGERFTDMYKTNVENLLTRMSSTLQEEYKQKSTST